jgi:pimeloyl-ACP methyl ester carboxylesterase
MELLNHPTEVPVKSTVIALHCAGANGSEWRQLDTDLGPQFKLVAPNLIGNTGAERWSGKHAFTLSDEAASVVSEIDAADEPVHLVGHSYGGAVALRAAIERPARLASLMLYEPAAFHILKTSPEGRTALIDIDAVAAEVGRTRPVLFIRCRASCA